MVSVDLPTTVQQEIEPGAHVLLWPADMRRGIVDGLSAVDEIDHVSVANASGPARTPRRDIDNVTYLDRRFERPVSSHDVPGLIEDGRMDPVDMEYAHDVAMDLLYDGGGRREAFEAPPDRVDALLRRNTETSSRLAQLADDRFVTVWDVHDYDPAGQVRDAGVGELDASVSDRRALYHQAVEEALRERFPQVSAYKRSVSRPPMAEGDTGGGYETQVFVASRG